jgi:hypothetical protein
MRQAAARSATVATVSEDEEEEERVAPRASGSTRPARGKKLPIEQVEDEMLRLMELKTKFHQQGLELLRTAKQLREWRELKFGPA